jgi:hypothetical protein
MDPAVKALWLTALKSGKYKQGTHTLKRVNENGTEHCCLGVLCEIAVAVGVVSEHYEPAEDEASVIYEYGNDMFGYPPKVIRDWADLEECDATTLASRNDQGHSFEAIAEYISANY